jgi:hypothetical protein
MNIPKPTPEQMKAFEAHLRMVRRELIPKIVAQQKRKAIGANEIANRVLF